MRLQLTSRQGSEQVFTAATVEPERLQPGIDCVGGEEG